MKRNKNWPGDDESHVRAALCAESPLRCQLCFKRVPTEPHWRHVASRGECNNRVQRIACGQKKAASWTTIICVCSECHADLHKVQPMLPFTGPLPLSAQARVESGQGQGKTLTRKKRG